MVKKESATKPSAKPAKATLPKAKLDTTVSTDPIFPYTNKPQSLRKFLQILPEKPIPKRVDGALMKSWGFKDTNDMSMLRVLKTVGLLKSSNEPDELWAKFMSLNGGAAALAQPIREVYGPLFEASHKPYTESPEVLKNLFNIHSGGSKTTLDFQIQTFKALAENADFETSAQQAPPSAGLAVSEDAAGGSRGGQQARPMVHIDLHIHLPENKARRDYEAIIEDIGRYIYGRTSEDVEDS